jgi:hypothetical protein
MDSKPQTAERPAVTCDQRLDYAVLLVHRAYLSADAADTHPSDELPRLFHRCGQDLPRDPPAGQGTFAPTGLGTNALLSRLGENCLRPGVPILKVAQSAQSVMVWCRGLQPTLGRPFSPVAPLRNAPQRSTASPALRLPTLPAHASPCSSFALCHLRLHVALRNYHDGSGLARHPMAAWQGSCLPQRASRQSGVLDGA